MKLTYEQRQGAQRVNILPPRVAEIIGHVAKRHGVTTLAILSESRLSHHVKARQAAMREVRQEVMIMGRPASYPLIGQWFQRDHTTVLYAMGRPE